MLCCLWVERLPVCVFDKREKYRWRKGEKRGVIRYLSSHHPLLTLQHISQRGEEPRQSLVMNFLTQSVCSHDVHVCVCVLRVHVHTQKHLSVKGEYRHIGVLFFFRWCFTDCLSMMHDVSSIEQLLPILRWHIIYNAMLGEKLWTKEGSVINTRSSLSVYICSGMKQFYAQETAQCDINMMWFNTQYWHRLTSTVGYDLLHLAVLAHMISSFFPQVADDFRLHSFLLWSFLYNGQ